MRMKRMNFLTVVALSLSGWTLLFFSPTAGASEATGAVATASGVIARLGERAITAEELEQRFQARLYKVRQDEYEIKVNGLKELAFELLQEQEATKEGISKAAYYKREVTDQVAPPKDDEIEQIFKTYRSRLPGNDDEARAEVRRFLSERNAAQRADAFKNELLARAKLKILLEPPRIGVPVDENDPKIGPVTAPVQVVEFSDFQCPYCGRAQTVVKQLRQEYGDRVQFTFKQLPLGMHQQARLGAEIALCAAGMGKYWEAREWLFANQNKVTLETAKEWAKGAGLEEPVFARCVEQHLRAKDIDADLEQAESIDASSTPIYYVNGRQISGARPIEQFREVIDDELARTGK